MSEEQARYQSLAASGAVLIAFIGVCHEAVGQALFPWGPAFFGGPLPWHALGILTLLLGLALLGGALRLFWFPVTAVGYVMVVPAVAITAIAAVTHRQFHMFAIALGVAGAVMAYCHRRSA